MTSSFCTSAISRTAKTEHGARRRRAGHVSVRIRALLPEDAGVLAVHQLLKLSPHTRIAKVKTAIEHGMGILPDMYRLTYLDTAPMDDDGTLFEHDVIDGSTLDLRVWKLWADLLEACHRNQMERCLSYPEIRGTSDWGRRCAWSALFVAAHKGHHHLVSAILERTAVDVDGRTPSGWTSLHAAARTGMWKALCVLINGGASVRIADEKGMTAFDLARGFGNKKCEDTLGFCHWSLQKYQIVQDRKKDYSAGKARENASRRAHQFRDSTLRTWLPGSRGALYMSQIPNPVTLRAVANFDSELCEAAKSRAAAHAPAIAHELMARAVTGPAVSGADERSLQSLRSTSGDKEQTDGGKTIFHYGWFDPLRAQHFIPPTNDILNYTDPSSYQLRPRSIVNPGGYKTERLTTSLRCSPFRARSNKHAPPPSIGLPGTSTTEMRSK